MAGKVSLIVIWASLNKNGGNITCLMSNGIVLLKRPYISLIIATIGLECENNFLEVMAWESVPVADFNLRPLQCQVWLS